jgi:3-phenylpropionate/cinnamic acid dioxygenase small subunit
MSDAAIAIPALLARYADLIDAGDFVGAAALFDGGCIVAGGRELRGVDAIRRMWGDFVQIHADGTPRTRHLVSNVAIELDADGEGAACRSQWTVLQAIGAEPPQIIGSGRYLDRFVRVQGLWHFARREYGPVDFWGDTSAHLKIAPKIEDQ